LDHAHLYRGGDRLLLSTFPLALLLNIGAATVRSRRALWLAGAVGAGSSLLFLVRYSGALSVVGLGCAWLWGAQSRRMAWSRAFAWPVGAAAVAVLIRLLGLPG